MDIRMCGCLSISFRYFSKEAKGKVFEIFIRDNNGDTDMKYTFRI